MKTLLVHNRTTESGLNLRQCLADRGYEVTLCRSTEEAQQRWGRERFPLVVLDVADPSEAEHFCAWFQWHPARKSSFVMVGVELSQLDRTAGLLRAGAEEIWIVSADARWLGLRLALIEQQLRRREEWQRKADASNTRAQQQVTIAAMGQCALTEDLPTLMDLVSRFIMHTLDVEFCNVLELAEDKQSLQFVAGFGWREGYVGQTLPLPPADSLTGRTLRGDDFVVLGLNHDQRFREPDFLADHGVLSAISVAIKGKEKEIFGVLGAGTAQQRVFVEDELRFLEGLANVLGAAIQRRRAEAEIQKQQNQVQHLQRLESVGQLAAGLAHDYNNVLTVIHGHVTLALRSSALPPNIGSSLKVVLEAVERAAGLTRQMLSFSRKQSMQLKAVDLNQAIAGMARLLDRVLGRDIQWQVNALPGLPAVQADPGMLDQVVMNLAVNARDAMPNGGRLSVSTSTVSVEPGHTRRHPDARPGQFVCLCVADSGCGMDEATQRRIFDPFFTTKEPGKGTGLGLSTVYGIVKQHQGWIEVESAPGKGTTFRIFIPSAPAGGGVVTPGAGTAADAVESRTILLVEDEAALRVMARMLLEEMGHQVTEAGSGNEALRIWDDQHAKVEILMTDLVLPDDLTGFELAERFQRQRADLKVIFVSGYSADHVRDDLAAVHQFQFVQKPYRAETLAQAIQECFRAGPMGASDTGKTLAAVR